MTLNKAIEFLGYSNPSTYIQTKENVDFSLIKKFPYIQVADYWFDNPDDPDENNWIDVEGMGYGWIWDANWFRRRSKFLQRRAIRKLAYGRIDITPTYSCVFVDNTNKGEYIYGFMIDKFCFTEIKLSDHEINF